MMWSALKLIELIKSHLRISTHQELRSHWWLRIHQFRIPFLLNFHVYNFWLAKISSLSFLWLEHALGSSVCFGLRGLSILYLRNLKSLNFSDDRFCDDFLFEWFVRWAACDRNVSCFHSAYCLRDFPLKIAHKILYAFLKVWKLVLFFNFFRARFFYKVT